MPRIRGLRRALTDDEQDTVAKEIVEHLELSNWKIGTRTVKAAETALDIESFES